MKLLSTLKTLPVVSVLALGMALSPTLSIADNDKRGRDQARSHDSGKSYNKGQMRSDKRDGRATRSYNKHDYKYRSTKRHGKRHGHGKHIVNYKNKFGGHGHGHGHKHKHGHSGHNHRHSDHSHTNVIVHDVGVYDYARRHYLSLNDLGFTFGLHGSNFDFVIRD